MARSSTITISVTAKRGKLFRNFCDRLPEGQQPDESWVVEGKTLALEFPSHKVTSETLKNFRAYSPTLRHKVPTRELALKGPLGLMPREGDRSPFIP